MIKLPDFERINSVALANLESLLPFWLPGGRRNGPEFVAGSVDGEAGRSLSINLNTGVWKDFSSDEGGSDPVSLFAAVHGLGQADAARRLAAELGIDPSGNGKGPKPQSQPKSFEVWRPILPIPEGIPAPAFQHPGHGRAMASWVYRDVQGRALGHVCRFELAQGRKEIIPLSYCQGPDDSRSWKWKSFPVPRPMYGLDRLAAKPHAPVLLVEGEKTSDAAERLLPGTVSMTWPGGSKAVGKTDFSPLANRRVVIWPDADKPGFEAARLLISLAKAAGAVEVSIIAPPGGVAEGWDLADAEAEGWDSEQVKAHIKGHKLDSAGFDALAEERYSLGPDAQGKSVRTGDEGMTAPGAGSCLYGTENEAWKLARELFPRVPFPWEVFPPEIVQSLKQLARACATSSNPLPGQTLCLMAAAVGRKLDVMAKASWREPLVFWACDIRPSGAGKTGSMWMLADELTRRQHKEHDRFKAEQDEWVRTSAQDRQGQTPPRDPRGYFTTNLTLEGVHTDLDGHPTGGLAVLLSELSALISGQNQYKKGGSDREGWLCLHDGKPTRVSRARGSVFIQGARVQVCGGIQPAIFRQVFGGEDGQYLQDGTIFRVLFTFEPPAHFELTAESWTDENRKAWCGTLDRALDWADGRKEPHLLVLAPDAQARFFEWRNTLDAQRMDLPPTFRGFLPKAFGYALRIAGTLHALDRFASREEPGNILPLEDMERGILAVHFYLGQAVDALRLLVGEGETVSPVEVSGRSLLLAQVLETLRGHIENGRLAVGFIHEAYNSAAKPEERMNPHSMGALLRSCGLTVSAGKHNANGRRGVYCLQWDERTDSFLKQCSQYPSTEKQCGFQDVDLKSAKSAGLPPKWAGPDEVVL